MDPKRPTVAIVLAAIFVVAIWLVGSWLDQTAENAQKKCTPTEQALGECK